MDLNTTLVTIIAFSAVLSVLSVIFHWLLTPVKENQARLESGLKENQARLESGLKESQDRFESGLKESQDRFESGLKEVTQELVKLRKDFEGRK